MSEGVIGRTWRLLRDHELKEELLRKKIWKIEVSECILFLMILVYSIIFSYYSIMRHYSLRTYAWDIGSILQSMSSVRSGYLFKNNVEIYLSASGTYFGIHFSPIFFLVVPFFYIFPSIETLFIIQTIVLSLSAMPVYLLAKHHLKDRLTVLLLSIAYLLNPLLQSINWFDFPPQTFLPLLLLSSTYFLKKRNFPLFLLFIILSLMTTEQTSYFIILYAIYVALEVKNELKDFLRSKKPSVASLLPFVTVIIAILWLSFSFKMIFFFNPIRTPEFEAVGNFALMDIEHIIELPLKIISNPELALKAINYDFPSKILYIIVNFAPSAFLALLKPLAILPALLWLLLSTLSNHRPYYQLGFHYTALTLPFIIVGTIEALRDLPGNIDVSMLKRIYRKLSLMLLLTGLVLSMITSPLSPIQKPRDFKYFRDYGISTPSLIDTTVRETLKIIPNDALTVITPAIFPQIATNINVYTIPPTDAPSQVLYAEYIRYIQNIEFEYIIIDTIHDWQQPEVLFNSFIEKNDLYGLLAKSAGLYIYKRGYDSAPKNITLNFSSKELTITVNSFITQDASSLSKNVILLKASSEKGRTAWYGPYITLLPGDYVANFRLKVDPIPDEKIVRLDVSINRAQKIVGKLNVYGKNYTKPLTWQTFSIPFSIEEKATDVEFRGITEARDVSMWLDYIEVIPK